MEYFYVSCLDFISLSDKLFTDITYVRNMTCHKFRTPVGNTCSGPSPVGDTSQILISTFHLTNLITFLSYYTTRKILLQMRNLRTRWRYEDLLNLFFLYARKELLEFLWFINSKASSLSWPSHLALPSRFMR